MFFKIQSFPHALNVVVYGAVEEFSIQQDEKGYSYEHKKVQKDDSILQLSLLVKLIPQQFSAVLIFLASPLLIFSPTN